MPIVIIDKPQKTVQPKSKKKSVRKKPIIVEAQPLVKQLTASSSIEPLCPSCNSHLDYNALTDNYRCPACGYIAEPNEVN